MKKKKTLKQRLIAAWNALKWWWTGGVLSAQLSDEGSDENVEAKKAVARVVKLGPHPADCVSAAVVRGGHTILVRHDSATEAFVGKNYEHAATKAIEWLQRQGREIDTRKTSKLSYAGLRKLGLGQRAFTHGGKKKTKQERKKGRR